MAKEAMDEGLYYCGQAKKSHKGLCLATLERLIKHFPGGSYLVMEITPRDPGGRPLMAIGYKYSSRKFVVFIATEGYVSNVSGNPYLSFSLTLILMFLFSLLFVLTF